MQKLKDYLTRHKEKPAGLAKRAGCSAGSISDVLNGRREIGKALAKKISLASEGELTVGELMDASAPEPEAEKDQTE